MSGVVRRIASWSLRVDDSRWPYAVANSAAIDVHWRRRLADNSAFFNGVIHLLHAHEFDGASFSGRLLRTDFKSYLYWRDQGFPECGVRDAFGSALLRSADGRILLGRQSPGHINAGLTYLPGGFIDQRDVSATGEVALVASVAREVDEELGLPAGTFAPSPGAVVTMIGPLVSLAIELRASLGAEDLLSMARHNIARQTAPELEDVVAVAAAADLVGLAMPDYARLLLTQLFTAPEEFSSSV